MPTVPLKIVDIEKKIKANMRRQHRKGHRIDMDRLGVIANQRTGRYVEQGPMCAIGASLVGRKLSKDDAVEVHEFARLFGRPKSFGDGFMDGSAVVWEPDGKLPAQFLVGFRLAQRIATWAHETF